MDIGKLPRTNLFILIRRSSVSGEAAVWNRVRQRATRCKTCDSRAPRRLPTRMRSLPSILANERFLLAST